MSDPITNICEPQPDAHSPGPWGISGKGQGVIVDAGDKVVAIVRAPGTRGGKRLRRANLRLIAAAPDLLAFARRTLPMMVAERDCLYDGETDHNGEYRDDEGREAVEQLDREIAELRALIARAEGGAA